MKYRVIERDTASGVLVVEFHDGTHGRLLNVGTPDDEEAAYISRRGPASLHDEGTRYDLPPGEWTETIGRPPPKVYTAGPVRYRFDAGKGIDWHPHKGFTHDSVIESGAAELQYRDGRHIRYGDGYDLRRVVVEPGLEHAIIALVDGTTFVNTIIKELASAGDVALS